MASKVQIYHRSKLALSAIIFSLGVLLVFFSPFRGIAQQVRVTIEPDSTVIGQRAALSIEIDFEAGTIVLPPNLNDTLSEQIEIISFGKPDTLAIENNLTRIKQVVQITSWQPGFIAIPPLPFRFIAGNDTLKLDSEPLLWQVVGVDVAEDAQPFDIKPIFRMPLSLGEILKWAIPILLVIGLIGGFIYWYIKKRKKKAIPDSIWEKPEIPAHIAAISSLESLKMKKLWQNGKVKLYYSELTFILRMYLEKRYGIIALEMTSSEILKVLPSYLGESDHNETFRYILELADLVKFAKFEPQPQQNDECIEMALDFVKQTVPSQPSEPDKVKDA